MRASCYPMLLNPHSVLCIRQLKLPDRFVNRNHRILLAVLKSAIQAPWRRPDLSDCSTIGPQQSVAQDETFFGHRSEQFFSSSAKWDRRIWRAFHQGTFGVRAGSTNLAITCAPSPVASSFRPFYEGESGWERKCHCVEARRRRARKLRSIANTLLTGIIAHCIRKGVSTVTVDMNKLRLMGLGQLHLRVTPVGLPRTIESEETMAAKASSGRRQSPGCVTRKANTKLAQPKTEHAVRSEKAPAA
ncbi:hypothetical protein SAMN02927914_01392 [Mesorhizobium qingshengii]|uniref:Uncharacterized protein n=1 Tax=Mesorhizobium qingshengii TaxID=1165689 RepID=A0A1G5WK61_9HYPH|nr:hypothetical protein SAMN02927914_01392 [Mesorhizobium qingshengii]